MLLTPWALLAPVATATLGSFDLQQPLTSTLVPSKIPFLGFGTWNIDPANASEVVSAALQAGYRHIDCATAYGNQKEVGRGIADGLKKAGVKRSDIWITSKLWNDHHDPTLVEEALDQTLFDLGLDYLDLWLMHWPVGNSLATGESELNYIDVHLPVSIQADIQFHQKTWHAMEKLHQTDKVRKIGVSNFSPAQLKDIIDKSDTKPAVHQMEIHPYLPQSKWIEYHHQLGIAVTAYSPFANTNPTYTPVKGDPPHLLKNADLLAIAAARRCTAAQVALVWGWNHSDSVIPKSSQVSHLKENFGALNCHLEKEDLERIDGISKQYLKRFNNPSKDYGVRLFDGLEDA
ncbi:MAG: hypothetical protein Q9182_005836 [Xanthomendoza sp. 2 TL-2023]